MGFRKTKGEKARTVANKLSKFFDEQGETEIVLGEKHLTVRKMFETDDSFVEFSIKTNEKIVYRKKTKAKKRKIKNKAIELTVSEEEK